MHTTVPTMASSKIGKRALASAVIALALTACGEAVPPNDNVAQRPDTPTSRAMSTERTGVTPPQAVPSAAPADTTPPAGTPSTHAGEPKPPPASGAPTARDTPGQAAASKSLSPAEESRSMPMPGQTDNHFTPSADARKTDAPKQ